jgi:hypothetical protein
MIQAYQVLVERLHSMGVNPKMHILDNECSDEFKEQIKLNNMKYPHTTTGKILQRKQSKSSKHTS